MSESDDSKSRQRRNVRTGALEKVLAEMSSKVAQPPKPPVVVAPPTAVPSAVSVSSVSPAAQRPVFFPAKGPATVPPDVCRPWDLADRPEGEFDHLDELVRSFKAEGQLQPAVVRPLKDPAHPEIRYELIAGQARWRAARQAGTMLDVIVRPLDDEAAFRAMVGENEFRRGLSDYAKGKRLAAALARGLYKDKGTLAAAVGLSNSQLSYLLGFAELDPAVVTRFKNIGAVSARLGYSLNQAVKEGMLREVLRDLPRIEAGEIPRDQVPDIWRKSKDGEEATGRTPELDAGAARPVKDPGRAFVGEGGQALFLLKASARKGAAVTIPAAVAGRLDDAFWDELKALLERRLK